MVKQYLGDLLDQAAMAIGGSVTPIRETHIVREFLDDMDVTDVHFQLMNPKQTLDLVTCHAGKGKHKARDKMTVAISGDGKRLWSMDSKMRGRILAQRIAMQAEVARLCAYLGPIINARGSVVDFISRTVSLAARRRYRLDMTAVDQDFNVSIPYVSTMHM
jgi:hypothetical protein